MKDSNVKKAISSILEIDEKILESDDLEVIEEALGISTSNVKTSNSNKNVNFDRLWKDVRAIFKLLDKTGVGVAKNVQTINTLKITLVAAALEIRRQVKSNQKDLASLKKTLEKDMKDLKKTQEDTLKELKAFKKMMDLYANPPAHMGPISRKTLKVHKGIGKE